MKLAATGIKRIIGVSARCAAFSTRSCLNIFEHGRDLQCHYGALHLIAEKGVSSAHLLVEVGLRHDIREYLTEGFHQGLDGAITDPTTTHGATTTTEVPIICDARLGGILRHYRRDVT